MFLFSVHSFLLGLHIYHLFGVLWVGNFILALGECTLAGGFASWYWAYKKPKVAVELSAVGVDTYTHYAPSHYACYLSSHRMFPHLH